MFPRNWSSNAEWPPPGRINVASTWERRRRRLHCAPEPLGQAAQFALRILNGENASDVPLLRSRRPLFRMACATTLGHQRKPPAGGQRNHVS